MPLLEVMPRPWPPKILRLGLVGRGRALRGRHGKHLRLVWQLLPAGLRGFRLGLLHGLRGLLELSRQGGA